MPRRRPVGVESHFGNVRDKRYVAANGVKFARQKRIFPSRRELFALLLRKVKEVFINALKSPIRFDEALCALRSHSAHAPDIVRCVAGKSLVVGELARLDAV